MCLNKTVKRLYGNNRSSMHVRGSHTIEFGDNKGWGHVSNRMHERRGDLC